MMLIALDTSVAVPLLVTTHSDHAEVMAWSKGKKLVLSGHAAAETYSVLTRLPGDIRLTPADAARMLSEKFAPPLVLATTTAQQLTQILAGYEISGGAVYDAIVALAAAEHDCVLATRDARAESTYNAIGIKTIVVAR